MKNKTAVLWSSISILLTILACNISKARPDSPTLTELPVITEPPVEQNHPSGLPTLTLQAGSGYLFDTAQVVAGSDDRDIWWNRIEQAAGWILESRPFEPAVGEAFLVEVTAETEYAIIRVLSFGGEGEISFEYLFPFEGSILP
ncbi:MAG: hypothetical protein HY781_00325 [Chloroflexi bacterium]|nr:hypothetical protein [Chloroflexota bacterium]